MSRKITIEDLKQMITEEKANIGAGECVEKRAKQTREIKAADYADTLENKIDYMKALKIEAKRLERRLARVNESLEKCKKLRVSES